MTAQEIYEELGSVWGTDFLKYKTIITWARKFGRTRINTFRKPSQVKSGRQKVLPPTKNVDAIYDRR